MSLGYCAARPHLPSGLRLRANSSATIHLCSSPLSTGSSSRSTSCSTSPSGFYYKSPRRKERQRVLPLRPQRPLVAGRHLDGRHHLRRRHAARRHRHGRDGRHRGQLAVVELRRQRHAHRLLLRAPVAALRRHDRHRIRRDPLLRQARRVPARLPRALPRHPHQLHHPRLGQPRDGQDPAAGARRQQTRKRSRSSWA